MEEEQPSASKQFLKKKESQQIISEKDKNDGSGSDRKSNTGSDRSSMSSYSARSRLVMPKVKKGDNRDMKVNASERKRKRRPFAGRVNKRKRNATKRRQRITTRKPREKIEKKERERSASTIFTRLSECSEFPRCLRCGHRFCRRRSDYSNKARGYRRYKRNNKRKVRSSFKNVIKKALGGISVANQMGSRAQMLSPLFIKSNSSKVKQQQQQKCLYSEISPEMIHQALIYLTKWREEIQTDAIFDYIKASYPVDPDVEALAEDLAEKLRVAVIAGIVCRLPNGNWWLPTALQNRTLAKNHVTLFWQAYADTMRPVTRAETVLHEEDNSETKKCVIPPK